MVSKPEPDNSNVPFAVFVLEIFFNFFYFFVCLPVSFILCPLSYTRLLQVCTLEKVTNVTFFIRRGFVGVTNYDYGVRIPLSSKRGRGRSNRTKGRRRGERKVLGRSRKQRQMSGEVPPEKKEDNTKSARSFSFSCGALSEEEDGICGQSVRKRRTE